MKTIIIIGVIGAAFFVSLIWGIIWMLSKDTLLLYTIEGNVVFTFHVKDNSYKKMVVEAMSRNVPLDHLDLSGRDLSGLDLSEEILDGCDFSDANLSKTLFINSSLVGVNLSGANLEGAFFYFCTMDEGVILPASAKCVDCSYSTNTINDYN